MNSARTPAANPEAGIEGFVGVPVETLGRELRGDAHDVPELPAPNTPGLRQREEHRDDAVRGLAVVWQQSGVVVPLPTKLVISIAVLHRRLEPTRLVHRRRREHVHSVRDGVVYDVAAPSNHVPSRLIAGLVVLQHIAPMSRPVIPVRAQVFVHGSVDALVSTPGPVDRVLQQRPSVASRRPSRRTTRPRLTRHQHVPPGALIFP